MTTEPVAPEEPVEEHWHMWVDGPVVAEATSVFDNVLCTQGTGFTIITVTGVTTDPEQVTCPDCKIMLDLLETP